MVSERFLNDSNIVLVKNFSRKQ